jgi:nicotinate-nucleotide adenylyltransferase
MKIGILGGTFDPIHGGHLVVAEVVRTRLELALVLFAPAGQPWLKVNNVISAAEHRLEMVRLAIAGKPYFQLSTLELEREGPTYTIDTLRALRQKCGTKDEIFFILGWDNLLDLPRWQQPGELIALCRLVAVPRVGFPVPDLTELEKEVPGVSSRVILLDKPEMDVSASVIRERVCRGLSVGNLVPEAVVEYIGEHGLYK